MRRPTFCNNSVAVEPPRPSDKDEGRLTKVKRMFTNSFRKPVVNKVFTVPLDELTVNKEHVPKVLLKMTTYIETYGMHVEGLFRLSGGNPSLVEQLKSSFNRTGDADLEACLDVSSVASLLKLWLRDLPEPLVTPAVTAELVTLLHKYGGEAEWCGQARAVLQEIPVRNSATLQRTLALLHMYSVKQPPSAGALPLVFAPLLLCAEFHGISTPETNHVVARLIHDYPVIYSDKVAEDKPSELKQRKRKERHNSDAASLDRKFVRSNSEERPSVEEKKITQAESIRRVSSHEDFSRTHKHSDHNQSHGACQPLHERNNWPASTHSRHSHKHRPSERQTNNNGLSELIESSPSPGYASDLFDENEHERRRQSERHAPLMTAPRTRRRKSTGKLPRQWSSSDDADGSSSKENEEEQPAPLQAPLSEEDSPVSRSTSSSSSHSFLQLHPQEEDRSPSPVPLSTTPPPDLSTLRQQMDFSEPLPSRSFRHPQGGDRLVSPRNSIVMTRRVFAPDDTPQNEGQISQISKQIHSLKRKLKRFEEGFEKEFGYRPSHAEKMTNPETKKMCSLLTKLRKEVKILKEEGSSALGKVLHPGSNSENKQVSQTNKEESIHDVEKKLSEKRVLSCRPERVEEMSREQLVEEKLAVQKGLLYLENTFGRPSTKDDRDLVRPLYDRYRSLKRLLVRNAPSKLKDNVTELGTILEHETMDFTSSSPPPGTTPSSPCPLPCVPASPPRSSTPDLENLHAMPLSELLKQQQITREEKKRLRRSLREFEEECQKTMGRKLLKEDRLPMEQTYTEYKHAKAKLRLLEALLLKKK